MHTTRMTIRNFAMTAAVALLGIAAAAPAHAAGARAPVGSPVAAEEDGVINLNTATEDELVLLPGVGPSKAGAILAWRTKHGTFKKVDDLTRVKGFGRKTLTRLRQNLAVSGATTFQGKKANTDEKSSGVASTTN